MRTHSVVKQNKGFGFILLALSCLLLLSVVLRVSLYRFEYDPKYYATDFGRWNYFSYFTVQSNLLIAVYAGLAGLSLLGLQRFRFVLKPQVGLLMTTYILITGAVYCSGFPLGMTPPLTWDTPYHCMLSSIQILHHMISPLVIFCFWLSQGDSPLLSKRALFAVGIYPFVYSLISIARGAFCTPTFYTYPFYNPRFAASLVPTDPPLSDAMGYLLMIPMMVVGIGLFILVACILRLIHNKQHHRNDPEE